LLVVLPAVAALFAERSSAAPSSGKPVYEVGAPLIYRQDEASTRPVPEARDIQPSERGEFYYYSLVSYLRVVEVLDDDRIVAVGSNQKRLCFWPNNSGLRKAGVTERVLHPRRFPRLA
jgi:hypothetical protein